MRRQHSVEVFCPMPIMLQYLFITAKLMKTYIHIKFFGQPITTLPPQLPTLSQHGNPGAASGIEYCCLLIKCLIFSYYTIAKYAKFLTQYGGAFTSGFAYNRSQISELQYMYTCTLAFLTMVFFQRIIAFIYNDVLSLIPNQPCKSYF